MAQGGGPLIVAGREHAAYCFEVLSCNFSGESPAAPQFTDHHWCGPRCLLAPPPVPSHTRAEFVLRMVAHSRVRSSRALDPALCRRAAHCV